MLIGVTTLFAGSYAGAGAWGSDIFDVLIKGILGGGCGTLGGRGIVRGPTGLLERSSSPDEERECVFTFEEISERDVLYSVGDGIPM